MCAERRLKLNIKKGACTQGVGVRTTSLQVRWGDTLGDDM